MIVELALRHLLKKTLNLKELTFPHEQHIDVGSFSILGGEGVGSKPAGPTSILGGGWGRVIAKCT